MKCRPEYGAARVEEPLPEWMEKPSRTESKLQYDARFYQKEGIVFDCEGARTAASRDPAAGALLPLQPAAAAKYEKRGVVSYRFRKIEESIL